MHKLKTFLLSKPVFLYLLPVFFVLHGFTENFNFVPPADALKLLSVYWLACIILSFLFWLFYKNFIKANLVAFCIMAFHFFFGSIHDSLKKIFHGAFITKYSFILPASLIIFLVLIIILKKTDKKFSRVVQYLNFLLLLLLIMDTGWLFSKIASKKKETVFSDTEFTKCDSCAKPDIYFILADEYAGTTELNDLFHFDNSSFENDLQTKGFYVLKNSFSNYNYTSFSLASILNMNYLDLKDTTRSGIDLTYSYQQIKNSRVIKFFEANGYQFYNYSLFDFEGQPARIQETFLPAKTRLITSQTFLSRIQKDLWFNLITVFKSKKSLRDLTYYNLQNNQHLYELTWRQAEQKNTSPKFVYTHLMMPHYPYYFDRNGKAFSFEELEEGKQVSKEHYVEYLQYTNKKLTELIDHILKNSPHPPIIILMGDHGFRHFTHAVERKYYFLNFSSFYFPDKNYSGFRDSMSTVNEFRLLLNNEFHQHLPLLKDSTTYLRD